VVVAESEAWNNLHGKALPRWRFKNRTWCVTTFSVRAAAHDRFSRAKTYIGWA